MPAFIVSLVSFFESIAIFIVFCIFLSTILLDFLYRYIGKQNKTINQQKNYEYQIEVLENYIDKLLINSWFPNNCPDISAKTSLETSAVP